MIDYNKQIEELQYKIEVLQLEKQIASLEVTTCAQDLAIKLHDLTCTHNHTDGCGWEYEIDFENV